MQEVSKQEYIEFFKWLFGENIEIKEEFDITMAPAYENPNIYYTQEIYNLFQTRAMQRLEKITQLGAEFLLNSNTYHNRLEHSKGAYRRCIEFLATQYRSKDWREYIENNHQKGYLVETIKFMCTHDVGHSILSHSIEELVGNENCTHEDIGDKIRQEDQELKEALKKVKANEINSKEGDGSLKDLCEGNIDFDRCDFLSRDMLFTGEEDRAKINQTIQRLNQFCSLETLKDGTKKYVYSSNAIKDIETFLLFRKEMYISEYRDKECGKTEKHIKDVLRRIIESSEESDIKNMLQTFYDKNIDEIDIDKYLNTNDMKFFNSLIKLMKTTKNEELKLRINSIIPKGDSAFEVAVNMINPKNINGREYNKEEKEFLENVRKIIDGELNYGSSIDDYILAFETENEQILNVVNQNNQYSNCMETEQKKLKIYNSNIPIYVKNSQGQIVKFDDCEISKDISPRITYRVYVFVENLKKQGYTQTEMDEILNKLKSYETIENQNVGHRENKVDNKTFSGFFDEGR